MIPDGAILSRRINGRVFEYIDYTEAGENRNSWFWIGYVISLFSSVGAYYTFNIAPPYISSSDEYLGLSTSTFVL